MRNHPSVIYLRDQRVVTSRKGGWPVSRQSTVTLAFKVVQDLEGMQHLVAAVAVPHPEEALIMETMDSHMGLDSFPIELDNPKSRFPFIKSQGRELALSRLNEAIARLPEEENFRGSGYACASNTHVSVCQGGYYQLLKRFIYVPEGQVVPFLDMAKPMLTQLAIEMFTHLDDQFEAWRGTSLDKGSRAMIDLHTTFSKKDL